MSKQLVSQEHQKFIDAFFEHRGDVQKASETAGYAPTYGYILVRTLRESILETAEQILALHAPQAAFTLVDGLNEERAKPIAPAQVECAKQILDRIGIIKKEQVNINAGEGLALFILPPKDERKSITIEETTG